MATIVEHLTTRQRLVLIGAGFDMYSSRNGHPLFGDLAPNVDQGAQSLVCATDESGSILWVDSNSVRVVSVDGQTPAQTLRPYDAPTGT